MFETLVFYLIFGGLAGVLSGLFGIGGGVVLVPFLIWAFTASNFPADQVMVMAVATSLATIILTSLASTFAHHRRGAVDWFAALYLAPGLMAGSAVGSVIADQLPVALFKLIFSVFLIGIAIRLGYTAKSQSGPFWSAGPVLMTSAGTLIGALSAIVGIGGGSLSVPFLNRCGFDMRSAVGTSSACGFPIAAAGTASYVLLGLQKSGLPGESLGYVHIPAFLGIVATSILFAPLGARLAHWLPTVRLKRWFAILLLVIGLKMLWQSIPVLFLDT
jgi:uncharacterized protein